MTIRDARTPPHEQKVCGIPARCMCEDCDLYYRWEAVANELTEAWDDTHCASCGAPHQWHGRDEADRVCPECRFVGEPSE